MSMPVSMQVAIKKLVVLFALVEGRLSYYEMFPNIMQRSEMDSIRDNKEIELFEGYTYKATLK